MNLYVESLANYIKQQWDETLAKTDEICEARFIVESLDPHSIFDLFTELEEHRLQWQQQHTLECHFRVAAKLWKDWLRTYSPQQLRDMVCASATDPPNQWIDHEDRLTWYRNRTRPEHSDGLIIVLAGLNHASDQGGLADFHRVDENRIWQTLQKSFYPWIQRLIERYALSATDSEIERLDNFIQQLFQVCPRRLAKLAEFFEQQIFADAKFYTLSEVIQRCYAQLPFWGIPPLLIEKKASKTLIKEAGTFIAHQRFKTAKEQQKAWEKLQKAFDETTLDIPETCSAAPLYASRSDFQETLCAFIFAADAAARERLLQTNLRPVLELLKQKTKQDSDNPPPTKDREQRLSGPSLIVLLQAVWNTLSDYQNQRKEPPGFPSLQGIRIIFQRFNHDLQDDDAGGIGGVEQARQLLQGCLGGLPDWFADLDTRLPRDLEQASQPCERWERTLPITLDLEAVTFGVSRSKPHLQFSVILELADGWSPWKSLFRWAFGPTHPERVRYSAAETLRERWAEQPADLLPAFQLPSVVMTALYFAADPDEAHRLISQALNAIVLTDQLSGLLTQTDSKLIEQTRQLTQTYRAWLECYLDHGYYLALRDHYLPLLRNYRALAEQVLDPARPGSAELLRRFYKAFLLIDDQAQPNDNYLRSAIVWGLSPPLIELSYAQTCFLCNHFAEVIAERALQRSAQAAFDRLLNLGEIHRPLAGLVIDPQHTLSAAIKSFGLLHYLGLAPSPEKSLAVQTLLREDDDDEDDLRELARPSEESAVVEQVLNDYQALYPFAQDGLRILAVHVQQLATILPGVDRFLRSYLRRASSDWPAFHCELTVYSTSSSPLAVESRLAAWREAMLEICRSDKLRPLTLSVSHRFAPDPAQMIEFLQQEKRLYDIGFLFHFMSSGLTGEIEAAQRFAFHSHSHSHSHNINPFPIGEYPRPIQQGDALRRQSLLSHRRLLIQTSHANLSARLRHPQAASGDYLILGHTDYQPWEPVAQTLHQQAQWVACIDSYVDKRLVGRYDDPARRKIVGFSSGLGAYGELNLAISTEQDTLTQLTELVQNHLAGLLPFQPSGAFAEMATRVVDEAEEIIGLSSLRAVVGQGERIREVVGFAAIRRALAPPPAAMSQLLPIDTLLHWFAGSEDGQRPDLLWLSLIVRENDLPLIQALVLECKFAQHNPAYVQKASDQVRQGLRHFTRLFAPNRPDLERVSFDRRYWWAQLQRALTSRSLVALSEQERRRLNQALESLAEGDYEIAWQGAIFTFWTNLPGAVPLLTPLPLPTGTLEPPWRVPEDFALWHIALGYEGVTALFGDTPTFAPLTLQGAAIRARAGDQPVEAPPVQAPSVEAPSVEAPSVAPAPPGLSSPTITVPDCLLIGARSNGEPVYWHYGHPQLANRHLLIFGATGVGKTYGVQCLLAEMAQQHLRSIIVDYTDGFLPLQIEPLFRQIAKPNNHFIMTDQLPLNPFRRQQQLIDPSRPPIEETPFQVATRIASIFTSVFNTMGDQQASALIRVLETGMEDDPTFTLERVLARLRDEKPYGETLAGKLEPLIRAQPFRPGADSAWDDLLHSRDCRVHVLQLKGLAREIQRLVTEFILWDLYDYACNAGSKDRPIPLVLDEIQNLDHRSDSPIDKMLREGRKFGLSLILATQTTSQFSQEARDRLFQAGHKLFFKPADTEIERFAQLLSQSTGLSKGEWGERLARLEKGQCWSFGPVLTSSGGLQERPMLASVTPLERRRLENGSLDRTIGC